MKRLAAKGLLIVSITSVIYILFFSTKFPPSFFHFSLFFWGGMFGLVFACEILGINLPKILNIEYVFKKMGEDDDN